MDVFSINQLSLPSNTLEEKHVQELVGGLDQNLGAMSIFTIIEFHLLKSASSGWSKAQQSQPLSTRQ